MTETDTTHLLVKALLEVGYTYGASITSKGISAPFERVKLLMQTQDVNPDLPKDKKFEGFWDAYDHVLNQQGVISYWKGTNMNAIKTCVTHGSRLLLQAYFRDYSPLSLFTKEGETVRYLNHLFFSGIGETISLIFIYPFDFVYTRQCSDLKHKFEGKGPFQILMENMRDEGLLAMYSGMSVAIAGIFLHRAFSSAVRKLFELIFETQPWDKVYTWKVIMALTSGSIINLLLHPVETIKRKLIVQTRVSRKYDGVWSCIKGTYENEGLAGFFSGCQITIVKGAIATAAVLAVDYLIRLKFIQFKNFLESAIEIF